MDLACGNAYPWEQGLGHERLVYGFKFLPRLAIAWEVPTRAVNARQKRSISHMINANNIHAREDLHRVNPVRHIGTRCRQQGDDAIAFYRDDAGADASRPCCTDRHDLSDRVDLF